MTERNGGEALVAALKAAGVTHIFGILGSSTMEVYDALYDEKAITYIGVRDERSGTHMADAFGRVSGRPGVILAGQAGPGASNLLTGLIQAKLAYSPVVAIAGLASSEHLGRDAFQEFDQQSVFSAVTKRTWTVTRADRIPEFVREAVTLASVGRRGPVVLNIPRDLFAQSFDDQRPHWDARDSIVAAVPDPEQIERIKRLLLQAKSPVIVAGGGVKAGRGWEAVTRLADALALPIATAAGHPDAVPNDHPLFAGQVGPRGNPAASRLTREADVILAFGTRLGFNTTFYTHNDLAKAARIVQVDVDPAALGRFFPIEIGIAGDAGAVAAAIAKAVAGTDAKNLPWSARNEAFLAERAQLLAERERLGAHTGTPMRPERVFAELRSVLPRNSIVTLDAGTLCLQATDQLRYFTPPALLSPLDFGLVGFSYAAGLGAKAAAPDRPVVTLMGDGGFAMTMGEITTAVQHGLATVAVVLDNGCWGAEKAYQRDFYNGRYIGCDVLSPPYDGVAKLCGAEGYAASKPGEVAAAVADALKKKRPAVVHVKVDPEAIVSFRRDSFKHRRST
ncbi:MAG: thiamine pyrophosphate-binding protein [Rhodospirillales bacterium]|nr:thiamine pyrophosphate-binding protein [Rhodospirillales bacterium]